MAPDLAMLIVRVMAHAHRCLPASVRPSEDTPAGHLLMVAANRPGPLIKQVRDVLQRMALEWERMAHVEATPEAAAAMQEHIPLLRAVKNFVGHVPRTPLTEPIVSAIVTTISDGEGTPVKVPPWCPVSQSDMARACRVEGRDGVVLRWVFLSLAGWYASTEPGGPARIDVQTLLDGALAASKHERKETATLAPLAEKVTEGLTWMGDNPFSLLKLLYAKTWEDIEKMQSVAVKGEN